MASIDSIDYELSSSDDEKLVIQKENFINNSFLNVTCAQRRSKLIIKSWSYGGVSKEEKEKREKILNAN
jgi:hypothetical protein